MKHLLLILSLFFCLGLSAQSVAIREVHKVKKHETIFGISRDYGITIDELIDANPEMRQPGYELKKGAKINIPAAKVKETKPIVATAPVKNSIDVGIMLPLHSIDGDGKRMTEYYRGILTAVEQLKKDGININMHAWNVAQDVDMRTFLSTTTIPQLDIIFGPLYSKQVRELSNFCRNKKTRMVIPFSIYGDDVDKNEYIYQIYQSQETVTERSISSFLERFSNYHPVFVDCNDTTSRKGIFTFALRKKLEEKKIEYNITNLNSSSEVFAKSFSLTKRNIVILNTGRSPELTKAMHKLDLLTSENKNVEISMFGYTEWQMYEKYNQNQTYFHKYNVYVPTTFYYNEKSGTIQAFEKKYLSDFGTDMMNALPHFAVTGYDHAMYFIGGLHKYKTEFNGSRTQLYSTPLQTPLYFRQSPGGGFRNNAFQLIHYKTDGAIESFSY